MKPSWFTTSGELISEAVAVFIIIAFGDSVAAMYALYNPSPYQNAYWGVCIAWGLAVTIPSTQQPPSAVATPTLP